MFIALDKNQQPVSVEKAKRGELYYCPVCHSQVTFKSGHVRVPHFSHYRIVQCIRYLYKAESIEHLKAKHDLYLHIKAAKAVDMEVYLDEIEQIPDLLMDKTVIEIQLSTISIELLTTRTKGYESLGLDVYWLLDETSFNPSKPTSFQLSTMKDHHLFTYDIEKQQVYLYRMNYSDGFHWYYQKEAVDVLNIDKSIKKIRRGFYPVNKKIVKRLVEHARQKRSVLDVTIGALYQLDWHVNDIPDWMCVVTPSERWIFNKPLEWKLFIYKNILYETFTIEEFQMLIKLRMIRDTPDLEQVTLQLLREYYMLNISQNVTELEI